MSVVTKKKNFINDSVLHLIMNEGLCPKKHTVREKVFIGFTNSLGSRYTRFVDTLSRIPPTEYAIGTELVINQGVVELKDLINSLEYSIESASRTSVEQGIASRLGLRKEDISQRDLYLAGLKLITGAEPVEIVDDSMLGYLTFNERYSASIGGLTDEKLSIDYYLTDARLYGKKGTWSLNNERFIPAVHLDLSCVIERKPSQGVYLRCETIRTSSTDERKKKRIEDRGLELKEGLELLAQFNVPEMLANNIKTLAAKCLDIS